MMFIFLSETKRGSRPGLSPAIRVCICSDGERRVVCIHLRCSFAHGLIAQFGLAHDYAPSIPKVGISAVWPILRLEISSNR